MIKNTLLIALVIVIIYLYYQQKKTNFLTGTSPDPSFTSFLKDQLNSNTLEELKSKLGEKNLNEILEENEDYETEVDTLTRSKNSLEQDLTAQSNSFQSRLREKDREIERLKKDLKDLEKVRENLTSEKQQHKGSLERIKLLTEQITNLENQLQELKRSKSPMPGEFPTQDDLTKQHQDQLRKINLLFDDQAKDYQAIDFNGLYSLLQNIADEQKKKKKNSRGTASNLQSEKETKKVNHD
jgi:chromosome segregation ATPase